MTHTIFDLKNKVTIVKETGTYPHENNCYHVKITTPEASYDIHFLPKVEYELASHLRALSKILHKEELAKIMKLIEEYGDHRYQEAMDSAAMDAAGEAL